MGKGIHGGGCGHRARKPHGKQGIQNTGGGKEFRPAGADFPAALAVGNDHTEGHLAAGPGGSRNGDEGNALPTGKRGIQEVVPDTAGVALHEGHALTGVDAAAAAYGDDGLAAFFPAQGAHTVHRCVGRICGSLVVHDKRAAGGAQTVLHAGQKPRCFNILVGDDQDAVNALLPEQITHHSAAVRTDIRLDWRGGAHGLYRIHDSCSSFPWNGIAPTVCTGRKVMLRPPWGLSPAFLWSRG